MYSHRVHFTAADRLIETRTSRLTIIRSHYDVDINPVVKVVSQKKPKSCSMLSGNSLKEQEGDWADAFAACTFDGRKNASPLWLSPWPLVSDTMALRHS